MFVFFTSGIGVSSVTAGGTPSVFVAANDVGPNANRLNNPFGITKDGGGNLYVSNEGNGAIVKIAPDASTSVFYDAHTTSELFFGIAVDQTGNVFTTERIPVAAVKITQVGILSYLTTALYRPDDVAVDTNGIVYSGNDDGTVHSGRSK